MKNVAQPGSPTAVIGWIGLGDQGVPLVRRLRAAGREVLVWARRTASLDAVASSGVTATGSPVELGAGSDVVCLCVTADADVLSVAIDGGLVAAMRPGAVLVIVSTVSPQTCLRVAEVAAASGVRVVDAPVSRDGATQEDARYALLVGGETATVADVLPVLRSFSDHQFHLGALGSGQRMKIVNNAMAAANLRILYDALAVGEAEGLDAAAMLGALGHTSGGGVMVDLVGLYRPVPRADYVALLGKDVELFAATTDRLGRGDSALRAAADSMIVRLRADVAALTAGRSPDS